MSLHIKRPISIAAAAIALLGTATLSSCTSAPQEKPTPTATEVSKEAGIFTKDIEVCFTNTSSEDVELSWVSGLSSNDGEGTLSPSEEMCGEGPDPRIKLVFSDGFGTYVDAYNPVVGEPYVWFSSLAQKRVLDCSPGQDGCHQEVKSDVYTENTYSQGETAQANFGGHLAEVSRLSDNDWINFAISIVK